MSLTRMLLQAEPVIDDHADGHDHGSPGESYGYSTKELRIAAIFIILAAGLLGGLPPLWLKMFRTQGHPVPVVMRALAAGIILGLALVHIIPEAIESLDAVLASQNLRYDYHGLGGACVAVGIFLMIALESITHTFMDRSAARKLAAAQSNGRPMAKSVEPVAETMEFGKLSIKTAHVAHTPAPNSTVRAQVLAILFEAGCIFHSVIIGITVGVNQDQFALVQALIIALAFHQWLEGIALGSFISLARLPKWKSITMIAMYALTCPIGIAIGLGISDSYNPDSITALAVQGVFNGVSGGLLLYIGLVQLVAEDFGHHAVAEPTPPATPMHQLHDEMRDEMHTHGHGHASSNGAPRSNWFLLVQYCALAVGFGCISMIGMWL